MKKYFAIFASLAIIAACNKEIESINQAEVEQPQPVAITMKTVYLGGGQTETRTVYNKGYEFAWNSDDTFYALCKSEEGKFAFYQFALSAEKNPDFVDGKTAVAIFQGTIPSNYEISKGAGEILGLYGVAQSLSVPTGPTDSSEGIEYDTYAAAMAAVKYAFSTEIKIDFDELGETISETGYKPLPIKNIPMVATKLNTTNGYSFTPAVGFIRFAYQAVPFDAVGLRLTVAGKKMSGEFGITAEKPYIALEDSSSENYVMEMTWGSDKIGDTAPDVFFYVPVPVGTYNSDITVMFTKYDEDGTTIIPYSSKATKTRSGKSFTVEPGHVKPFNPFLEPQYDFTVSSSVDGQFNVGFLNPEDGKFYTFRNGGKSNVEDKGGQNAEEQHENHSSHFYTFIPYTFSGWQDTPVTLMAQSTNDGQVAGYQVYFTSGNTTYILSKNDAHANQDLIFVDQYYRAHSILFEVDRDGKLHYDIKSGTKEGTCYLYFDTDTWAVSLQKADVINETANYEYVYVYGITEKENN